MLVVQHSTIAVIALKCPHMYIVGVIDISVLPINAWNSDQVPHLRALALKKSSCNADEKNLIFSY
uniref:Uncharacterized protein n=1 Tax=Brassica campestris TaxID=3711 RepID=A0A3P6CG86_BRACM|nr:unnamed protein product [Brassica rapa]